MDGAAILMRDTRTRTVYITSQARFAAQTSAARQHRDRGFCALRSSAVRL
jgi:hypothetical protein